MPGHWLAALVCDLVICNHHNHRLPPSSTTTFHLPLPPPLPPSTTTATTAITTTYTHHPTILSQICSTLTGRARGWDCLPSPSATYSLPFLVFHLPLPRGPKRGGMKPSTVKAQMAQNLILAPSLYLVLIAWSARTYHERPLCEDQRKKEHGTRKNTGEAWISSFACFSKEDRAQDEFG